jgi:SAM-dependent methyltransferase
MSLSTPASNDARSSPGGAACRVCGGRLEPKWRLQVLGRHDADYHECVACGCLQIPEPHWLDEAYQSEGRPREINPDGGRFIRNFSAYIYLRALHHAGFFGPKPSVLDYGGGSGILAAMLRGAGFPCRQYDPFCPLPMLEPELAYADAAQIPAHDFAAITALEVFEHLVDPIGTIRQLAGFLKPNGTLVISTGLYDRRKHGPDWPYPSRPAGQHVTFYTRRSLAVLGEAADLPTVCLFPADEGFLILFTRQDRNRVGRMLRWAAWHLRRRSLHSRWTVGAWDLLQLLGTRAARQPLILP